MTIIKTGDPSGGVKNKHNQQGISKQIYKNGTVRYRAEIQINRKKYYLGIRDSVEDAIQLRLDAEKQIKNNTFHEWLEKTKHPDTYNKFNRTGISECKISDGSTIYRTEIKYNGKRHYIAKRKNLQEAHEIMDEAEKQIENGTFEEWLQNFRQN